jgi:CBS-domain-containing membrane protein
VKDLISRDVCCCFPDTNLKDVERIMSDSQIRRVVVVDDVGCCIGIVAQADLARAAERRTDVSDSEVGRSWSVYPSRRTVVTCDAPSLVAATNYN